jgi:hypothetical protein
MAGFKVKLLKRRKGFVEKEVEGVVKYGIVALVS